MLETNIKGYFQKKLLKDTPKTTLSWRAISRNPICAYEELHGIAWLYLSSGFFHGNHLIAL